MNLNPSLNDMIGSVAGLDWSWFDRLDARMGQAAPEAQDPEVRLARQRLAAAAARIAETEDGQLLLGTLVDTTLKRQTFVTQIGVDPMQALSYGAFREGQNAVVTNVLRLIAEGRGDAAPETREVSGDGQEQPRSRPRRRRT